MQCGSFLDEDNGEHHSVGLMPKITCVAGQIFLCAATNGRGEKEMKLDLRHSEEGREPNLVAISIYKYLPYRTHFLWKRPTWQCTENESIFSAGSRSSAWTFPCYFHILRHWRATKCGNNMDNSQLCRWLEGPWECSSQASQVVKQSHLVTRVACWLLIYHTPSYFINKKRTDSTYTY